MDENAARAMMERSVAVAGQSRPEDDRLHPKVGAVLADREGQELLISYRGQDGGGGHAEYALLEEAGKKNIDLTDKVLFVTLEPCSRRGKGKLPCAVRVARSGIKTVYVGTLDPNPQIIGRGVNFLIESGVTVEHYPADLRTKIENLNVTFRGQHGYLVDPIVEDNGDEVSGRQRAGILTTTLETITRAKGQVWLFSGDASWLRDLFVGLLEASLRDVPIKMLAQKALDQQQYERLAAIGIEVCDAAEDFGVRATMTIRDCVPEQLVVAEKEPARHAQLFGAPHDNAVLNTFGRLFRSAWCGSDVRPANRPQLSPIPFLQIETALRSGVRAYGGAGMTLEDVDVAELRFLTCDVEILKLRRVASTLRIMSAHGVEAPLSIVGTPWGFFPPIVERDARGTMVIVDGVHRVYDAMLRKRPTMKAIIVDGVTEPLPSMPIDAFQANIIPRARRRHQRYVGYDERNFRTIRQALERGSWAVR